MTLTTDDLIQMRRLMASAAVLQSGDFKDELDKIAAASAELDGKLIVAKTVGEAEVYKATVMADVGKAKVDLAEATATHAAAVTQLALDQAALQDKVTASAAQLAEASNLDTTTKQAAAALSAGVEAFKVSVAAALVENDKAKQVLMDRENAVKAGEAALQDRIDKLSKI